MPSLDTLFGFELPWIVKLLLAFAIVMALLGAAMWVFRRLGGARLGTPPQRGRQPRLAVIDAAAVDNRRRLVLIRRDNVEHLIMIGGPTDVVVEQNIVRAVPVAPPPGPRASVPEPERRMNEPPRAAEPPRPPLPDPARQRMDAPRPRVDPPRRPADFERAPPRAGTEPYTPPRAPAAQPRRALESEAAVRTDPTLAGMAQKLEAALRRPNASERPAVAPPPPAPMPDLVEPPPPTAPDVEPNGARASAPPSPPPVPPTVAAQNAKPASSANGPAQEPSKPDPAGRSVLDSLEEEMATLLSKPADKPEKK